MGPQVKHLPELWKLSIMGDCSAHFSIVSLGLVPEYTLCSATGACHKVPVRNQEE